MPSPAPLHVSVVPAGSSLPAVGAATALGLVPQGAFATAVLADGNNVIVTVGTPKKDDMYCPAAAAQAYGAAAIKAIAHIKGAAHISYEPVDGLPHDDVLLGAHLAHYRWELKKDERPLPTRTIADTPKHIAALAAGYATARDLANTPPNLLRPSDVARHAAELARTHSDSMSMEHWSGGELLEMGLRLHHAVGRGSTDAPVLVALRYRRGTAAGKAPQLLVGKGVTFDTGGYNLKPEKGMADMKGDMGGAAAVLGAMHALAQLQADAHVVALLPLAENMVAGNAYLPSDIITAYNGLTVEIGNTDAEGRLLLADALAWGTEKYQPSSAITIATLTGAVMTALGPNRAGVFSEDAIRAQQLVAMGEATGERLWHLPMGQEYADAMKGKISDLSNTGKWDRMGGASTAASFLAAFAGGTPYAHLDIAGPALEGGKTALQPARHTGWGVGLLLRSVLG